MWERTFPPTFRPERVRPSMTQAGRERLGRTIGRTAFAGRAVAGLLDSFRMGITKKRLGREMVFAFPRGWALGDRLPHKEFEGMI